MDFILVGAERAELLAAEPTALPERGFLWCDCVYEDDGAFKDPVARLTGQSIYDDHLRDATNRQHPSYFDFTAQYDMLIFRGLAQTPAQALVHNTFRLRTRPTVLIMLHRMLVTVRAPNSQIFTNTRARLMQPIERGQRMPETPEDLALRLLNDLIDRYLELRQPLSDLLERRQYELLDPGKPFRDWPLLLQARNELQRMQNLCEEQLDALQEWRDEHIERGSYTVPAAREAMRVKIDNLTEHIHRVLAHVRRLEQSAESAVQLHFSATAHRTNDIMRTLTALTAIFLPLNLVTGIFGMNFESIPGLHSKSGFWFSMLAMACIALGLLALFRHRRFLESQDARSLRQKALARSSRDATIQAAGVELDEAPAKQSGN